MNGKGFATQYVRLGRRAADFESGRRQMKLQVRVSPNGKAKAARPAQKPATAKSIQGYPQSTMVSSPIQSANDRRAARFKKPTVQADHYSEDDESDGFEPLRVAGKPKAQKSRELGPPITRDQKMDQLDHLHRAVAEDFEVTAKRYLQDVRGSFDCFNSSVEMLTYSTDRC
jgi:bloom syndrome protein